MIQAAKQTKILLRGIVQRHFWQAWSLLLLGVVGTVVVAWGTKKDLDLTAKRQFESVCNEIQIKIRDRLGAQAMILRSGSVFYENSGGVNRQAWRAFAGGQRLEQALPGIQGFGFALLVPREQLARHLQEIRAEGFPEYQVRPEGDRAIYSAIIYLEPFTNRNIRAFGYDMLTEPVRREAMERARDNDAAALSGKVTLVQETDQDVQAGTLMYVPVYRPGMAHATIAQRREAIIGWVYSPYRMNDLMRGILGKWEWMGGQRIRLQVYDGGPKLSSETLVFDSHPDKILPAQPNALLNRQSQFVAAGRSWVLSFTPAGSQAAVMDYGKVWIILICGVSLSLMLCRLETLLLAARTNAKEMQLLVETNPDNVILKDGQGRWMVANEPAKKLFQLGDGEGWRGKTDAELAQSNPRLRMFHEACIKSDEQTWKEGRHSVITEQGVGPDGKLQEHEVYKTPLFSPGGRRQGLVVIGRDMTARRQMERSLRFSEAMASQSRDIILRIRNSDGRILDANAAAESNYGYSRAELLAKTIYDIREKSAAGQLSQQMSLAFGQGILFETVHLRKDGSRLPVEVSSQGIQLEGEACIISVIRDISARKKVKERLYQLETAVAASATGIFLADCHGCIIWTNAAFTQLTGYSAEEVLGCTPRFLKSGRQPAGFYKELWGTILAGKVWKGELQNRRKDGTIYFEQKTITPVHDDAGNVSQFICVQEDVTERKNAEAKLLVNEARLRTWFEMPLSGLAVTSPEKGWLQVNDLLCKMLGYTREELYGMTWAQLTHPDDLPENDANFERVLRGETEGYSMEKRFLRKNGEYLMTDLTVRCARLADGRMDYLVALIQDITERKRAEDELRKAKGIASQKSALLKSILDSPQNVVIFSLDANYCYTEFTQTHQATIRQIWGVDIAVGMNLLDIISNPADRAKAKANFDRVLRGESFLLEEEYGDLSRLRTFYEDRYSPIFGNGGAVVGITVFVIDITERKQAEAALVAARDFHLQLLQNAPALIWRAGPDAKCNWFNSTWLAFTGRTLAQEQGDGWFEGVHPEDLAACGEKYLAAFHRRETFTLEYRLRRHDGEYRWISDHGRPFDLPGGGFGGYIGYCYDIHENKLAHELLERRVAERTREIGMLSEVIDQSTVAFAMTNPDGSVITCNEAYARLLGYSRAEILDTKLKWIKELTPPEWQPVSAEKLAECLRTRQAVHFEEEYLRKDGGRVPVELFVQPIYGRDDELLHLRAFVTDITERKQAEDALRRALAREHTLAEVVDSSVIAFCLGTPDGRLILVNQAYEKLTGYSRNELKAEGFSWSNILTPPEWRETEALMVEECTRTQVPTRYEKEYIHKDGRRIPVELFVQPVFDAGGKLIHLRAFVSDISERKKNAEELGDALLAAGRASRAKSEFLATMSHEIRTPMNIILGNTQLLQREASLTKEAHNKLLTINRSGEHLLTILNDILDLAKIESGRVELHVVDFQLGGFLADLFNLFNAPAQAKQLTFAIKKVGHLPESIQADQQKIRQILGNLLGNAVKFTKTGGIELKISVKPDAGNKVWLNFAVTDSGPGIAPDELSHIFEKFNQGKLGRQSESGSGLGLAICQEYARIMQGQMSVQSELGQGSTFQFEVPVGIAFDTSFYIKENSGKDNHSLATFSGYRILIADDVTGNREVLQEMVATVGFDCRAAANGAEALEIFARWQPHLILMDTRMPVMGGLEAIRRIRAADQGQPVKIISISATAYPEDRAHAQAAGADYFISKPVKYDELIIRMCGALGLVVPQEFELQKGGSIHPAGSGNDLLTAKLLAALPETWGHELREALLAADASKIDSLLKVFERQNPEAAQSMMKLAGQFDYEGILEQLDQCAA